MQYFRCPMTLFFPLSYFFKIINCSNLITPPIKCSLKLNIQKMKIMASGPITSWQIDRETAETVADFILRVSKITEDWECSHEIKRLLLFGRRVMTSLESILKAETLLCPQRSV